MAEKRAAVAEVITREYTIHLHKYVHGKSFKKRAPSAIKAIKAFALKAMGTSDVRVDPKLNKNLCSKGLKNVPRRVRVRMSRRRNEDESAKTNVYTLVSLVPVASVKGLLNETIDE